MLRPVAGMRLLTVLRVLGGVQLALDVCSGKVPNKFRPPGETGDRPALSRGETSPELTAKPGVL